MKIEELKVRLAAYMMEVMAAKAKSWQAKFAIGAGAVSVPGRLEVAMRSAGVVGADGEVDVETLRRMVDSGFDASGRIDALGGMVGIEKADADEFFSYAARQEEVPQ